MARRCAQRPPTGPSSIPSARRDSMEKAWRPVEEVSHCRPSVSGHILAGAAARRVHICGRAVPFALVFLASGNLWNGMWLAVR
jgi:hypothetical protein